MKTFGKIIICILVILIAVWVSYVIYNKENKSENTDTNVSNSTQNNLQNEVNNTSKDDEYIGIEENKDEEEPPTEEEKPSEQEQEPIEEPKVELTGKDKAIDIVQRKYAQEGQTVRFDHMEGEDYVIKLNNGTAITWYLVNGTTWEAEEY